MKLLRINFGFFFLFLIVTSKLAPGHNIPKKVVFVLSLASDKCILLKRINK